ncbi:hypothetical protein JXJ21_26700 [candidate division KSB1 bacterium]|nr:hypothetical protein [candidate division KSB1 bacterium]
MPSQCTETGGDREIETHRCPLPGTVLRGLKAGNSLRLPDQTRKGMLHYWRSIPIPSIT